MRPILEKLRDNIDKLTINSGYDQLQDAVDLGILQIDDMSGATIDESRENDMMTFALVQKIETILLDGGRYPLFDADASNIVRLGVEAGYFSPLPMARRLGADAAMADGLFDKLPNFQHAKPREIIDIRTELSSSLSAFRQGVRSLTDELDLAPEDPNFGDGISDAWNQKVAPALNEIEATIADNRTMRELTGRITKDSLGGAAIGGTLMLPATLAVAAGPLASYISVAGVATGLRMGITRAFIDEHRATDNAKKAQFYFLFGTSDRLQSSQ